MRVFYSDIKMKNKQNEGADFGQHLENVGKLVKSAKPNYLANKPQQRIENTQSGAQQEKKAFTQKTKDFLRQHSLNDQKKVFQLWKLLTGLYGSRLGGCLGDEPDAHISRLAMSMSEMGFERLRANLLERIDNGKEWPVSHVQLELLANSPTFEETRQAANDIFFKPKANSELGRVEHYVKKTKIHIIKRMNDMSFDRVFREHYITWWRDVMIHNKDFEHEREVKTTEIALASLDSSTRDKQVDSEIKSGKAFNNKFGSRIAAMLAEKGEA